MDGAPGFKLEKFAKTLLSPTSAGGGVKDASCLFMNLFVDAAPCIYLFIFKGQGSSS